MTTIVWLSYYGGLAGERKQAANQNNQSLFFKPARSRFWSLFFFWRYTIKITKMATSHEENVVWTGSGDIKILKWKVRKGSMVSKGSVLGLYLDAGDNEKAHAKKLKAADGGVVSKINMEEGSIANPGCLLLVILPHDEVACTHPTIMKDMCADCGADLRREPGVTGERKNSSSASVAMVHSIPELIVSQEQAMELGREDELRLLQAKKLVLLVDLDQTLIHTTNDNIPPNLKDVKHFQLWSGKGFMWYHTKYRPFTQNFLEAISKLYELHICTFGVRMYAHMIARLLDPQEKYFSHRILSRDECFDPLSKTANLKALFPCGDKMVAIIDDREDVWNYAPNLIHVKPYRFFQGTADINAPPGLTKSEHDTEPISHRVVEHPQPDTDETAAPVEKVTVESVSTVDHKQEEISTEEKKPVTVTDFNKEDISNDEKCNESSNQLQGVEDQECATDLSQSLPGHTIEAGQRADAAKEATPDVSRDNGVRPPNTSSLSDKAGQANQETYATESKAETTQTTRSAEEVQPRMGGAGLANTVVQLNTEFSGQPVASGEGTDQNQLEEIEWDDEDDYLLHLQEILTRIHQAYYDLFEQSRQNGSSELPDLKNIIPYVRKKTLKGANIVFSGMFPLNIGLQKSRAYIVAKALGANVQEDIVPRKGKNGDNPDATTHLVAAKPGTSKHKQALKTKGVRIVNGDWLWACNERWEWVDESLFPLILKDSNKSSGSQVEGKKRKSEMRKTSGRPSRGEENGLAAKRRRLDEPQDATTASLDSTDRDLLFAGGKTDFETNLNPAEIEMVSSYTSVETDNQVSSNTPVETENLISGNSSVEPDNEVSSSTPEVNTDCPVAAEDSFATTLNPLFSFSDEDIEFMDKEVEEMMEEEEDSSENEEEREARLRQEVLGKVVESDSESDSLSGEYPRGWKILRKSLSPSKPGDEEEKGKETDVGDDEETENELERYQKNMAAFVDDSLSDSGAETIGSADDEIAEAVEKEFLSSL